MRSASRSFYQRIFSYALPYKHIFVWGILLAVCIAVLSPLLPYLIKRTIDSYITPGATDHLQKAYFTQMIAWMLIIQMVGLALNALFRFLFSYTMANAGIRIVRDIREKVYEKILALKLSEFDKTPIGVFSTRSVNDIEVLNNIFSDGFVPIFVDVLSVCFVVGGMFIVDWRLALVSLVSIPLILLCTQRFKHAIKNAFSRVRTALAQMNAFVQEHLSNRDVIRAFRSEEKEFSAFSRINDEHRKANLQGILSYSIFYPLLEVISAISLMILLLLSVPFEVDNAKIIFFFLSINQIFRPLRYIADRFNTIQMSAISARRIFSVLDNTEVIHDTAAPIHPTHIRGDIRFKNVCFAYKKHQNVLDHFSLHIPAGQTVALVGYSGHGKTSIASLLNRLYQHQSGEILIDGINIEDLSLDFLRKKVILIPQNVFLFSAPLFENISLNSEKISFEQVVNACKTLGIHDHILHLPGGYSYLVDERGANLSAGQRQLICMARALVFHSSILILDEATSSMDTTCERLVTRALQTLSTERTIIIIAHRLSTIEQVDNIFFIEKGKIVEQGTHTQLLALNGRYASMYHKHKSLEIHSGTM